MKFYPMKLNYQLSIMAYALKLIKNNFTYFRLFALRDSHRIIQMREWYTYFLKFNLN